jgi:hypothetical protein
MDFKLKYSAVDSKGLEIKSGTVICKRKLSKFDAIAGYENHLKNKDSRINRIEVIYCAPKTLLGYMPDFDMQSKESFTNQFKDILKGNG